MNSKNRKKVLLVVLIAALTAAVAYVMSNTDLNSGKANLFGPLENVNQVMSVPTPPGYYPQIQNFYGIPTPPGIVPVVRTMLYSFPTPSGITSATEQL